MTTSEPQPTDADLLVEVWTDVSEAGPVVRFGGGGGAANTAVWSLTDWTVWTPKGWTSDDVNRALAERLRAATPTPRPSDAKEGEDPHALIRFIRGTELIDDEEADEIACRLLEAGWIVPEGRTGTFAAATPTPPDAAGEWALAPWSPTTVLPKLWATQFGEPTAADRGPFRCLTTGDPETARIAVAALNLAAAAGSGAPQATPDAAAALQRREDGCPRADLGEGAPSGQWSNDANEVHAAFLGGFADRVVAVAEYDADEDGGAYTAEFIAAAVNHYRTALAAVGSGAPVDPTGAAGPDSLREALSTLLGEGWHRADCHWTRGNPSTGEPKRPCTCGCEHWSEALRDLLAAHPVSGVVSEGPATA